MTSDDPKSLRREFIRRAERAKRFLHQKEERDHREKVKGEAELADQDFVAFAQAATDATADDLAAFDDRLDFYEQLTIEDIMRLRERIDELAEERELILARAYVLPDGKRAFKTEDGQRVFDEHGAELTPGEIDPNRIGDDKPSWETFSANTEELDQLNERLEDNLEFLETIDDIREERGEGSLSQEKLRDLEQWLEKAIPDSIRARTTAMEVSEPNVSTSDHSSPVTSRTIDLDTVKIDAPVLGG